MDYKQKYLKYKNKYLNLKRQLGGLRPQEDIDVQKNQHQQQQQQDLSLPPLVRHNADNLPDVLPNLSELPANQPTLVRQNQTNTRDNWN